MTALFVRFVSIKSKAFEIAFAKPKVVLFLMTVCPQRVFCFCLIQLLIFESIFVISFLILKLDLKNEQCRQYVDMAISIAYNSFENEHIHTHTPRHSHRIIVNCLWCVCVQPHFNIIN